MEAEGGEFVGIVTGCYMRHCNNIALIVYEVTFT